MHENRNNTATENYEEYQEGLEYSEEVKNAVRYGYQYRKEAESKTGDNIRYCLGDVSDILFWIANLIIGGLSWDLLKGAVKRTYEWIQNRNIKTDKETCDILTDETQLRLFYVYVKEFNDHNLLVDDEILKYLKEEIVADYMGEVLGKIYLQENRIPEIEEYKKIAHDALMYAEKNLHGSTGCY